MIDSWALQTTTQRAERHPHLTSSQLSRAGQATQHHPRQTPKRDFRCVIRNVESHAMLRNLVMCNENPKPKSNVLSRGERRGSSDPKVAFTKTIQIDYDMNLNCNDNCS